MALDPAGIEVVYPDGCAEIIGSLRPDQLRKRINDLNAALRDMLRQSGIKDESIEEEPESQQSVTQTQNPIKLNGLLLHLLSRQFTNHPDIDIRLRVCVSICTLLKLFCPTNPFEGLPDSEDQIKNLYNFLNESISNISKVLSKHDVNYPRLFTILYTCCKLDVFTWFRMLGDGDKYLLECLKTLLSITKNISVWAWSDEATVQEFILNTLVRIINQSSSLLTNDVVAYLLSFLIEPAKSSQPTQHALVKDLILLASAQLEYPIQMLIQNSLVLSDQKYANMDPDELDIGIRQPDPLGEYSFIIIYALHTLQESLVAPILPCIEVKLKSSIPRERKRAFRLLTRIFAEPNSTVHTKIPELWESFLSRFNDIDVEIRGFCVQMVPLLLRNPELPRESLITCLTSRVVDKMEPVRLLALKMVSHLIKEPKNEAESDLFFQSIYNRSWDRVLSVRKEALTELAAIYKHNLTALQPNLERMTKALNVIMQLYYQPSIEDKIIVERLFKSSIVPYNFGTNERVKALFTCYQLADDSSVRAIQELFKFQFVGSSIMREALEIIVEHQGKRIMGKASNELVRIIRKLSNLLPKGEKAIDHLKKFFAAVHTDSVLRSNCCQLFNLECPSKTAARCMLGVLKRVSSSSSNSNSAATGGGGGGETAQYEHSVKVLVERCASVLFDEVFGQELLTRLVVSMETSTAEHDVFGVDLVRDLRILLALAVCHKDTLPADDVLQYINSVLATYRGTALPHILADAASADDPRSPVELCLEVLICLFGGGPIYGSKDSAIPGSGASTTSTTSLEHATTDDVQAALENRAAPSPPQAQRKTRNRNGAEASGVLLGSGGRPVYSGSVEQLCEQVERIMPMLAEFCTKGLTAEFPPQPVVKGDGDKGVTSKSKRRADVNHAEEDEDEVSVGQAGLAWRRERRRAKLSVRVLRQILSTAHALAGKHSRFPRGPISSLDPPHPAPQPAPSSTNGVDETDKEKASETASSTDAVSECPKSAVLNLEVKVQQTLDDIVKICLACELTSPDYITCLTTLGHVGLLFPGVYNRHLKALIVEQLIPNVLTKDELVGPAAADETVVSNKNNTTTASGRKRKRGKGPKSSAPATGSGDDKKGASPSEWTLDGNVPIVTRAKIAAMKLMANWLVGLKLMNKQVAQIIFRLIHRIVVHDGDLTCKGEMSLGDMSRMRLVAATSWLKIAQFQFYAEVIEVSWYQSMTYVICDPCPNVRERFLEKLSQGLIQLKLPLEYMAMFAHVADVPDVVFRQRAKQHLVANVKQRRAFLARHGPFTDKPKLLFALLPDYVLTYAIHLLAHDPDWEYPQDRARLSVVKSALWFIMEPVMAGSNNYTFLRQLLERIKHSQDALRPEDESINTRIYIACDIALGILLTRCTNIVWKGCEFEIKLPRSLFHSAPSSFSNPDFAQLVVASPTGESAASPLVTFTPMKNAKAVRDGLIPPQFLRVRGAGKTGKKAARKRTAREEDEEDEGDKSGHSSSEEEENEEAAVNVGNNVDLDESPTRVVGEKKEENGNDDGEEKNESPSTTTGRKRRRTNVAATTAGRRSKRSKASPAVDEDEEDEENEDVSQEEVEENDENAKEETANGTKSTKKLKQSKLPVSGKKAAPPPPPRGRSRTAATASRVRRTTRRNK